MQYEELDKYKVLVCADDKVETTKHSIIIIHLLVKHRAVYAAVEVVCGMVQALKIGLLY